MGAVIKPIKSGSPPTMHDHLTIGLLNLLFIKTGNVKNINIMMVIMHKTNPRDCPAS